MWADPKNNKDGRNDKYLAKIPPSLSPRHGKGEEPTIPSVELAQKTRMTEPTSTLPAAKTIPTAKVDVPVSEPTPKQLALEGFDPPNPLHDGHQDRNFGHAARVATQKTMRGAKAEPIQLAFGGNGKSDYLWREKLQSPEAVQKYEASIARREALQRNHKDDQKGR